MRKKVAFVVIGSLLLAVLATAVSFAAAPAMLGVGRVMCGADAEFVAHVGQTEYLPDGQPVGSLSMRCHENAGGDTSHVSCPGRRCTSALGCCSSRWGSPGHFGRCSVRARGLRPHERAGTSTPTVTAYTCGRTLGMRALWLALAPAALTVVPSAAAQALVERFLPSWVFAGAGISLVLLVSATFHREGSRIWRLLATLAFGVFLLATLLARPDEPAVAWCSCSRASRSMPTCGRPSSCGARTIVVCSIRRSSRPSSPA